MGPSSEQSSLLRRFSSHLAISACVLAIAATAVYVTCDPRGRGPSDQKLIATFQNHRGAFEHLYAMAAQDADRGWRFSWDRREGSQPPYFSQSRWEDYENQISQIHPAVVSVTMRPDGILRFIFDGGGFGLVPAGSSWSKGIEYIPAGLENRRGQRLPDLSKAPGLPANNTYIREIEPQWFLFYDRDE